MATRAVFIEIRRFYETANTGRPTGRSLRTQTADVSLLAVVGFTVQIYCDFAGYSLIARGLARLFGISLMLNFKAPFLALDPSDFWRRWHISLSSWLRDYLYVPIGGNRHGQRRTYQNLMTTMLLGGLWHGAAWNFVIWGLYHGTLLSVQRFIAGSDRDTKISELRVGQRLGMATLTIFGFLIFRVESSEQFNAIGSNIVANFVWSPVVPYYLTPVVACAGLGLLYQLIQERFGGDPEATGLRAPAWVFIGVFVVTSIAIVGFQPRPFIYFQF